MSAATRVVRENHPLTLVSDPANPEKHDFEFFVSTPKHHVPFAQLLTHSPDQVAGSSTLPRDVGAVGGSRHLPRVPTFRELLPQDCQG